MINPMFLMMRLVQTVPLSLLVFAAFPDRDLRQGRRRSCLISVSYMILSSVAMALLSPVSSENGQRNIIARDLCLVVFLRAYPQISNSGIIATEGGGKNGEKELQVMDNIRCVYSWI